PGGGSAGALTPQEIAALPEAVRATYAGAFADALGPIFLVAALAVGVAFALALLVPEKPLRETIAATAATPRKEIGELFPMPVDDRSAPPLLRGLAAVADRDLGRGYLEAVVARAGLDLPAAAAWLLIRLEDDPAADPRQLAARFG